MNKEYKFYKNPYFIISVVYLLAHFFLLILSGCWWDDWTFMTHDLEYVNMVASQSGRPEWNLLIPLCWSLTNNGRILIFFLYYLISIFVYISLSNCKLLNKNECLLISLLFTIIPVNDARLLISNFPYVVGLFFFFLALMIFIKWNNGKRKIICRILILILFLISFILNSLLAFYYLIFVYLFILDFKENKEDKLIKKIFTSIKNTLMSYFDFFILPFIFFFGNKLLFPITDSEFAGRSSVTIIGILKCFKYIPLSIISIIKDIFEIYIKCISYWPVLLICIVITVIIFVKNKNCIYEKKNIIATILFGLLTLLLGIFAYVEVRGGVLSSSGVKGRDTILVPFGLSIIVFGVVSLFNKKVKTIICALFIVLGIFSFNLLYIEWQKDYYCQLSMENLLNNEIVKNNDTFFLANLDETDIEGERYYSLNINGYHVFNDEKRLFIPKVSNLYMLRSKKDIDTAKEILNYSHMMKDYNPDDYNLDAVLIYDNNLDTREVIKLKYYEMFNYDKFVSEINKLGNMKIVEVDDDFTSKLFEEYDNGNINDDVDVVELLEVYYN